MAPKKRVEKGVDRVCRRLRRLSARGLALLSWIAIGGHLTGALLGELARLVGCDATMDPESQPALPAGDAVSQPVRHNTARQPTCNETLHLVVGQDFALLQGIDGRFRDLDPHASLITCTQLCTH